MALWVFLIHYHCAVGRTVEGQLWAAGAAFCTSRHVPRGSSGPWENAGGATRAKADPKIGVTLPPSRPRPERQKRNQNQEKPRPKVYDYKSAGTSRACVKTCAQRLGGLRVVQDSFGNTAQPTRISSISVLQDFQDFQLGTRPYGNPFV